MATEKAIRPGWTRSRGRQSASGGTGPPPVHLWNPPFCGDLDMRIAAGRHLVLPEDADRPARAGQAVRLGALARGRQVLPQDAGREGRHHGRRCAVHRRGDEGREGAAGAHRSPSAPMSTTGSPAGRDHALRFEPEDETGGLKPYLHVRRDLWALVTRALFYDLVELGEERDVDGKRMFGVRRAGSSFAMAPADTLKGFGLNGIRRADRSKRRTSPAATSSVRARQRLTLDVPPRCTTSPPPRARRSRSRSAPLGRGRREGDARRRRAGAGGRSRRAGRAAHHAHLGPAEATPGRSRFPAARSIRATRRRSPPPCARPTRRSGSIAR